MSNANSLSFREAGSLITPAVTMLPDHEPFWHPRTGSTAFLPQLAAATELLVIDLVAQHNPQSDPEFTSYRDSHLTQPLLVQLASVKALQLWISADGVHAGLTPEKRNNGLPCLLNPPKPLSAAGGVFAWDYADVTRQRFAVGESRRVA